MLYILHKTDMVSYTFLADDILRRLLIQQMLFDLLLTFWGKLNEMKLKGTMKRWENKKTHKE